MSVEVFDGDVKLGAGSQAS